MHPGTVVTCLVAKVGSWRFWTGILDPVGGLTESSEVQESEVVTTRDRQRRERC